MLELNQIKSFYPEFLRPYGRNLLREYLQYKILEMIFASKFAGKLFFMGGTAIHIVHALPRFSEDLEFDNRGLTQKEFRELAELISKKLMREGYKTVLKISLDHRSYHAYLKSKTRINNFTVMKKALLKRCKSLNFNNLAKEISPFLFLSEDAKKIVSFKEYIGLLNE